MSAFVPSLLAIALAIWYLRRSFKKGKNSKNDKPASRYERGGKSPWNQLNEGEDPTL